MVYAVPPSKASVKQNRFEFTVPGSKKTHSVPKVQYIKPAFLKRLRDLTADVPAGEEPPDAVKMALFDAQLEMFEHYVPGFGELFDDSDQIGALMAAWQAESNISLGESSASSAS